MAIGLACKSEFIALLLLPTQPVVVDVGCLIGIGACYQCVLLFWEHGGLTLKAQDYETSEKRMKGVIPNSSQFLLALILL